MQTEKIAAISDRIRDMRVDIEPIGKLETYANNAKIHTSEQVEQIKNAMRKFGWTNPILVWTNGGGKSEIIAGHGRLMAALELGLEHVPVVHLDYLTDEERRAFTHIDNQLTMNTGWDFEMLNEEIRSLDLDWEDFGFSLELENEIKDIGLSDNYSQNVGTVLYEPKETNHKPSDLFEMDRSDLDEYIDAVKDETIKKMLKLRKAWFCDFKFKRIADYYAYQATPEEQRAFEAMGLVLLDRDGLIENGFAELTEGL